MADADVSAVNTSCLLGLSQLSVEDVDRCYNIHLSNHLQTMTDSMEALRMNVDMFFQTVMGIIIYLMQGGFAILECGAVRSKNATNILTKNLLDSFIGALAYWLFGWALAFGKGNAFCGTEFWALSGTSSDLLSSWFFHFVFAATAATIVSGAVAERCEIVTYFSFSAVITGFVYPIVSHWAWSDQGWLRQGLPYTYQNQTTQAVYRDFAGSGVVHLLAGLAALVGAAFLGPRLGRFDKAGHPVEMRGHSMPLQALGGFILIFGFFAFNGGANGNITRPGSGAIVARAVVNTVIAGALSALICIITHNIYQKWTDDRPMLSLIMTINGGLAGMVAVSAGCDSYPVWASAVVGVVEGFNFLFWSWLVLKLHIDDPMDAVAVHAGGGLLGLLIAPFLVEEKGIVFNWDLPSLMLLAVNLAGACAITAWTVALCALLFTILSCLDLLRVDPETEMKGLDIPKHGEPAYPVDAYGDGWHHILKRRRSTLANIIFRRTSTDVTAVFSNPSPLETTNIEGSSSADGRSLNHRPYTNNDHARPQQDDLLRDEIDSHTDPLDVTYVHPTSGDESSVAINDGTAISSNPEPSEATNIEGPTSGVGRSLNPKLYTNDDKVWRSMSGLHQVMPDEINSHTEPLDVTYVHPTSGVEDSVALNDGEGNVQIKSHTEPLDVTYIHPFSGVGEGSVALDDAEGNVQALSWNSRL